MRKLLTLLPVAALALYAAACSDVITEPTANTPGVAPALGANSVTGAAFTTVNVDRDGTGHCKNGNAEVNCNIYLGKEFVWLTGGPPSAHLSKGRYFFAVLEPGGQHDPNDGGANNLSDTDPLGGKETEGCSSGTGCGDSYLNRVFTITDDKGTIKYDGSHGFFGNKIRLLPYDDTNNNGGVYILAICQVGDALHDDKGNITGYAGYPVDPSRCKYDAFKVREGSTQETEGTSLTAVKTAEATFDRTYSWTIAKSATELSRSSSSYVFEYSVAVEPRDPASTDSNHAVKGTITVFNFNPFDVAAMVSDKIGATPCTLDGTDGTITVPADGQVSVDYTCAVSNDGTNVAEIKWNTTTDGSITLGEGSTTAKAGFAFGEPSNEINKTITITDSFDGGATITLGSVTYPSSGTVTTPTPAGISNLAWSSEKHVFTYRRTIKTTADQCVGYKNTAVIEETGQDDSAIVTVCGPISGGYTIGFWGNKNGDAAIVACTTKTFKPYALLSALNLVNAKGKAFDPGDHAALSTWLRDADATNMSYMLSAQMAATWLNVNCGVNGKMKGNMMVTNPANPSTTITITQALANADSFLKSHTNTTAENADRRQAEAYKNLFDGLNNGWILVLP